MVNERGERVRFPDDYRGKTLIVSYIYTHCPDVCIATTSRVREVRDRIGDRNDVLYISITMDPRRDTPETLRRYAELWDIDTRGWHLLTGTESTVDSLLDTMGLRRRRSYIDRAKDGSEVYFLDHDDVVTIFDASGAPRATFEGNELDAEEVADAIARIS